jgi:hypothetical protein
MAALRKTEADPEEFPATGVMEFPWTRRENALRKKYLTLLISPGPWRHIGTVAGRHCGPAKVIWEMNKSMGGQ